MMRNIQSQRGFTLIELMIAIALGMLIVAAGLSLFISGLKSSRMQQGVLQVQDSGIFGLDYIADQVRLANYGNVENRQLNDQTPMSGIILTTGLPNALNVNLAVGNANLTTAFGTNMTTQSSGTATGAWVGLSNTDIGSDQLTIQFIAPENMHNCEGKEVRQGDRVVQRYFLREDVNRKEYDGNLPRLSLACDANTPTDIALDVQPNPEIIQGFSKDNLGEMIMPDVDYFSFLLGVRTGAELQYYTVAQYRQAATQARTANTTVPSIEMIKMAVLVKSSEEIRLADIDPALPFTILGQSVSLKAPQTTSKQNKFARRIYIKTIALRNALGDQL